MSELDEGYIVESLGERGSAIAAQLALRVTTPEQLSRARAEIDAAAASQTRHLPAGSLRDRFAGESGAPALGGRSRTLPVLRQLHLGLSHLFLFRCGG